MLFLSFYTMYCIAITTPSARTRVRAKKDWGFPSIGRDFPSIFRTSVHVSDCIWDGVILWATIHLVVITKLNVVQKGRILATVKIYVKKATGIFKLLFCFELTQVNAPSSAHVIFSSWWHLKEHAFWRKLSYIQRSDIKWRTWRYFYLICSYYGLVYQQVSFITFIYFLYNGLKIIKTI